MRDFGSVQGLGFRVRGLGLGLLIRGFRAVCMAGW